MKRIKITIVAQNISSNISIDTIFSQFKHHIDVKQLDSINWEIESEPRLLLFILNQIGVLGISVHVHSLEEAK